jgi:HK97 family phage prohead protease
MEHLTVKAVATATDLGEFTAIAATYDIDRVKEQIAPGAFERTIARWQASGKNLPVHWNHSRAAADIIGAIDPATMREVPDQGLYVEGKLDLQHSEVAREAWRSMKNTPSHSASATSRPRPASATTESKTCSRSTCSR